METTIKKHTVRKFNSGSNLESNSDLHEQDFPVVLFRLDTYTCTHSQPRNPLPASLKEEENLNKQNMV